MPKTTPSLPTDVAASAGFAYFTRATLMRGNHKLTLGIDRVRQATAVAERTLEFLSRREPCSPAPLSPTSPRDDDPRKRDAENFEVDMKRCKTKSPTTSNAYPTLGVSPLASTSTKRRILRDTNNTPPKSFACDEL